MRNHQPTLNHQLGSQITGWAQLRNDAAHRPDLFRPMTDQVKLMIDGVRSFIARIRS